MDKVKYINCARVVVNVPLPPEALPENAPQVEPQLLVLVEDFDFGADKIINFETTLSDLLREKFRYEIPHIFFYYPSPQDVLNQTISQWVYNEQKLCKIHGFFVYSAPISSSTRHKIKQRSDRRFKYLN